MCVIFFSIYLFNLQFKMYEDDKFCMMDGEEQHIKNYLAYLNDRRNKMKLCYVLVQFRQDNSSTETQFTRTNIYTPPLPQPYISSLRRRSKQPIFFT